MSAKKIIDQLFEGAPGLRLTVKFCMEDGSERIFPALVSKEPAPRKHRGTWRLTIFDQKKEWGLIHTNFELEKDPTLKEIQDLFADSSEESYILGDMNEYFNASDGSTAERMEICA